MSRFTRGPSKHYKKQEDGPTTIKGKKMVLRNKIPSLYPILSCFTQIHTDLSVRIHAWSLSRIVYSGRLRKTHCCSITC